MSERLKYVEVDADFLATNCTIDEAIQALQKQKELGATDIQFHGDDFGFSVNTYKFEPMTPEEIFEADKPRVPISIRWIPRGGAITEY